MREEGKGSGEDEEEEDEELKRLERFTGFGGKHNTEASVEEEIAQPKDSVGKEGREGESLGKESLTKTPDVLESVDTPQPDSESLERKDDEIELAELMWKYDRSHALLAQEVKKAVQSDEAKALIAQQREEEERRRREEREAQEAREALEEAAKGLSRQKVSSRELPAEEDGAPLLSRNKSEKMLTDTVEDRKA